MYHAGEKFGGENGADGPQRDKYQYVHKVPLFGLDQLSICSSADLCFQSAHPLF